MTRTLILWIFSMMPYVIVYFWAIIIFSMKETTPQGTKINQLKTMEQNQPRRSYYQLQNNIQLAEWKRLNDMRAGMIKEKEKHDERIKENPRKEKVEYA